MDDITPAAPAPPIDTPADPPETPALSPAHQAVADNDFLRFEAVARETKRTGAAPTTTVPAAAKGEPPAAPVTDPPHIEAPPTVSKRQQAINDRVRDAVNKATADLAAENAALKARLTPAASAPPVARPDPASPATLADTLSRPDLAHPPLPEGEFYTRFPDASLGDYSAYRAQYTVNQAELTRQRDAHLQQDRQAQHTRVLSFSKRYADATAADPALAAKVEAAGLLTIETREKVLAEGRLAGPLNAFASEIVGSEVAPQILAHLAEHPELVSQIAACDSRGAVIKLFGRIEARFDAATPPAASPPPPKTITDAPAPPVALGSRPAAPGDPIRAAVERNDFGAYEQQRFAARAK